MRPSRISLPELLLYLILFFGPVAHGLVETWSITAVHIAVIILLTSVTLTGIYRGSLRLHRTPVDLPIVLFCLVVLFSFFTSVYPYAGREIICKLITCLALFYFIVNTCRGTGKVYRLCLMIVLFSGIYAVLGLIWTNGRLLGFEIFSKGQYDLSLFFVNHNHFAGYLETTVWLAVGLATVSRGAWRLILFVLGILMAAALVFSLSRGGIIGLIGGLCFYLAAFVCIKKEMPGSLRFLIAFALLTFAVLAWLGLGPVADRMKTLSDPLLAGKARLEMWKGTVEMISERPALGWGPGTYQFAFPPYQSESTAGYLIDHAHNDYLELAAETGLAGLTAALCIMIVLFVSCLQRLNRAEYNYFQPVGIAALAGCFSFLVHAGTDFNFYIPSNAIFFSVSAAIAVLSAHGAAGQLDESVCMDISLGRTGKQLWYLAVFLLAGLSSGAVLSLYLGSRYTEEAAAYNENEEYDKAVASIQRALLFDPGNSEYFRMTGDMLLDREMSGGWQEQEARLKQALSWYEKAISACSIRGDYFARKALVLEWLGEPAQAERVYKEALLRQPVAPDPYYRLASLYLGRIDLDKAAQYFRRFLELGKQGELTKVLNEMGKADGRYGALQQAVPETAPFRRAFAAYLFAKGRTWPALHELEFAFSLEPTAENALAHVRGLSRSKDFTAVLEQTQAYLERFPESLGLREEKARILEQLGRRQEAVFIYRSLQRAVYTGRLSDQADRNKAAAYGIRAARLYAEDQRWEEAAAVLEQGTVQHPGGAKIQYLLGMYLHRLHKEEQALAALKRAVFLDTGNAQYRYQLGEAYRQAGLYQNAAEEWKKCLEVKPGFAQCKSGIDGIERELGLDKDLISYERGLAVQLATREEAVNYSLHIAELYARDERYRDAVTVLRKRIEKYPEEGCLYYPLGIYLRAMDKGEEALAALKKAVFFEYDNAEYRYQLGEEYMHTGLDKQAGEEWKICLEINPDFAPCKAAISGIEDEIGVNGGK